MTPGIFITGTNTGVGKTVMRPPGHGAIGRARASGSSASNRSRAAAQRGAGARLCNADALAPAAAASCPLPYELVNPYCFEPPLRRISPPRKPAKSRPRRPRRAGTGQATAEADVAIVEGAGGWRVPLHPEGFLSDLPERLGLGVVLVVGLDARLPEPCPAERRGDRARRPLAFPRLDRQPRRPRLRAGRRKCRSLERLLAAPPLALVPPPAPRRMRGGWRHTSTLSERERPSRVRSVAPNIVSDETVTVELGPPNRMSRRYFHVIGRRLNCATRKGRYTRAGSSSSRTAAPARWDGFSLRKERRDLASRLHQLWRKTSESPALRP